MLDGNVQGQGNLPYIHGTSNTQMNPQREKGVKVGKQEKEGSNTS